MPRRGTRTWAVPAAASEPGRLLYESNKQGPGGNGPQILTPLELLDRPAALVPPPRTTPGRRVPAAAGYAARSR